jgi:hypothetical protein
VTKTDTTRIGNKTAIVHVGFNDRWNAAPVVAK